MRLRKSRRNKGIGSKGFTMVELIVTMVILSMLLVASVTGILRYRQHADFKRNNEYAKSIFLGAQSALTHYRYTGKLEEFVQDVEKEMSGSECSGMVNHSLASDLDVEPGRLYYVYISGKGLTEEELEKTALFSLTEGYVYSGDIYNACIRIEFDPVEGCVYSVCYSDIADRFDETDTAGIENKSSLSRNERTIGVGAANREEEIRRKIILGYWSSDLAVRRPSEKMESED